MRDCDIDNPYLNNEEYLPETVHKCEYCDCEIVEGEEYYYINGTILCTDCIYHYLKVAEVND